MIKKKMGSDATDVAVGNMIRSRRKLMGLTQANLAQQLGITFQQFQKYETGKNRIGAGSLSKVADLLNVPISFFFEGRLVEPGKNENNLPDMRELEVFVATQEGLALNTAIASIQNPELRKKIVGLVLEIAQPSSSP